MEQKVEDFKNLRVSENVEVILGEDCHFNGMTIQNDGSLKGTPKATVRIGSHFHSGKNCIIRTSDHDFYRGYPMICGLISKFVSKDVNIGQFVWFGEGVLVMKGVNIGDGAIIQARSVVVSDIPPLSIAGGHPCRVFSKRDEGEFNFFRSLNLWGRVPGGAEGLSQKREFFEECHKKFLGQAKISQEEAKQNQPGD